MFPAYDKVAIEWDAIGDEETIECRAVMICSRWVIFAARQSTQRKAGLRTAVPVVAAQSPLLGSSHCYLWCLAVVKVYTRIPLKCAARSGEVDDGTDHLATAFHIQESHVLARHWCRHARIRCVKRSPPGGVGWKRLITNGPGNIVQTYLCANPDASDSGKSELHV